MKILLLEDDIDYQETMLEYLESLGYDVIGFDNGDDAMDAIHYGSFHLLLLDIRVPGKNGYEIVKTIRAAGNETPVIFVTSLTDIDNLSIGYELGCNDYLRKPFASQELKYRVEQVLKQFYFHSNENLIELSDGYTYNLKTQELVHDQEQVLLTKKEKQLLEYLIARAGKYIPTKQLWEDVWEFKMVTEADIRMCVKKIRGKTSFDLISSRKGHGYKVDRKR